MKMTRGKRPFNHDSSTKLNNRKHEQLLNDVLSLNKKPQLKKPSRTEPTSQVSEFNLVKSVRGTKGAVHISELTKVLKGRASHVKIGKKLKSAGHKAKTLPKPLEKPKAQQIRRTAAFENVKKDLGRWDAVVTSNRASNHLTFPLLSDTKLESSKNFCGFRVKTELQKKLEAFEPKVEVFNLEKESEYPLTMQEMLERRKETAKMRAVQSYKEAKARRQGKIKSKSYRRVQRKERIKQQMKEFEQLQKTNPGEALKKLEEIERVRVEERATLRHRSTGQWAKSKQIRAKYDKESRQELAQQLQVSRELTQKMKAANSDSESEEEPTNRPAVSKSSENNPWTNPIKTSSEVDTFLRGYRKFWETENTKNASQIQNSNNIAGNEIAKNSKIDNSILKMLDKVDKKQSKAELKLIRSPDQNPSKQKIENNLKDQKIVNTLKDTKNVKLLPQIQNKKIDKKNSVEPQDSPNCKLLKIQVEKEGKTKKQFIATTTDWEVSILSDDSYEEIDAIFDNFNDKVQKRLRAKYKKIKTELKNQATKPKKSQLNKADKKGKLKKQKTEVDLSFPQSATRPIIDEELMETVDNSENPEYNLTSAVLDAVMKSSSVPNEANNNTISRPANIDPNNIIKTKAVNLNTDIPDLLELDENEECTDQRGAVLEAFQDDDILEEFKKDKRNEIEGEKPADINLALPGWGSWGGTGIKPSKRKNKRFIIKFPKQFKRRDENKGHLIINEKANAKIKSHLVSELPFPFKTVKDFEASVRAPIGSTFVPETAFRKMIRPAVRTSLGTVIEPMTDDILVKKKK